MVQSLMLSRRLVVECRFKKPCWWGGGGWLIYDRRGIASVRWILLFQKLCSMCMWERLEIIAGIWWAPFLNLGMIMLVLHSVGSECRSTKERNSVDSGNEIESAVWWKKMGSTPSGPAAEFDFSFLRILFTMRGLIRTIYIDMKQNSWLLNYAQSNKN